MRKNIIFNSLIIGATVLASFSCNKVLDKRDLTNIDGGLLFNDSTLAFKNLSFIYDQNLPGWFGTVTGTSVNPTPTLSDEGHGSNPILRGEVTTTSINDFGTGLSTSNVWAKIRKINEFIRDVEAGEMPEDTKGRMIAEAKFFRAFQNFHLVKLYGGVPIVVEPMNPIGEENKEGNFLARSSTTESIEYIIEDLDEGIELLPGKWENSSEWGRITKGAAAAFKGRVLVTYASPQFNPDDKVDRWQDAYDANKLAKEILDQNGFGLHSSYQSMWFDEVDNPEAVLVTGYNTSTSNDERKSNNYDKSARPAYLSNGSGGDYTPSWDFIKSYPMLDGKKADDASDPSSYSYSDTHFYKNRDPRFAQTIAFNGTNWPILGDNNYKLWTYYQQDGNGELGKSIELNPSPSGFYLRKAVDPNISADELDYSGTDWMEIRYAEVLLNLAESAAGISQNSEAVEYLKLIRERAGIESGSDNRYGLSSNLDGDRSALFEAILFERKIEFAFEGKRFWDLRRWKLFEEELNGMIRQGLRVVLSNSIPAEVLENIDEEDIDELYSNYFTLEEFDLEDVEIDHKPEYYFFAIPQNAIQNNGKLEQNNTWGGSFDPLL
ncbi:MAG TPA: RagB/SusD family nutrient uptake outer membrane protein [Candidatus Sphingobacterium stercoripullorum]|nr:RagB/SusD family nutrient uptake outer membrane protein [Candidatus Sphingobacterium stercoripullorum]